MMLAIMGPNTSTDRYQAKPRILGLPEDQSYLSRMCHRDVRGADCQPFLAQATVRSEWPAFTVSQRRGNTRARETTVVHHY